MAKAAGDHDDPGALLRNLPEHRAERMQGRKVEAACRFIKEERLPIPCYTFVTDPFPPFWRGWASP